MEQEEQNKLDLSSLGSFDFTPAWAKKEAKVTVGNYRQDRDAPQQDAAHERSPGGREPRRDGQREQRKPFEGKPFAKKPYEKKPFDKKPFERRQRFEERPRPLDVDIKILPETKALGTIMRRIQGDMHAYKLKELAYFFLDNPSSVLLKIVPRKAEGAPAPAAPAFHQCKACGFVSNRAEDVVSHILNTHLCDYYDAKEVACEPPTGNFTCVAKCGLSGVLLGPPNIHEFNSVVREMIRTKYPEMSEEQYRSHIEMVRDAESIEAWRKSCVKKTVFFAKGQADVEGAVQMTRDAAEGEFKRTILPSLLDTPKHLMVTAAVAMQSPVKPLQWAVRDALEAERRSPYSMCFALRGALHNRKFSFFRANDSRGPEFVANMDYKVFDATHAIPELAAASRFIDAHPCCDKSEFPNDPDFERQLNWLVSTGHVVSFTNGVYSSFEKFPKYGPQWKKRSAPPAKADEEKPPAEEQPPVEETAPTVEQPPAEEKPPVEQPAPVESAPVAEAKEEKKEEVKQDETAAQLA